MIDIEITIQHGSFTGASLPTGLVQLSPVDINFSYFLQQNFSTAQSLQLSQDFSDKVGTSSNIQPILDACNGFTFTDILNCVIPVYKVDASGTVWTKTSSGINNPGEPINIFSNNFTFPDYVPFLIPATVYTDGVNNVYEYYEITFNNVTISEISNSSSLRSDRDYEVGIIYMDEFNRATTVLVSKENIIHIPCSDSDKKNTIEVTIPKTQLPPLFANRYKFAIKQDRDIYETIFSNIYYSDKNSNATYFLLEGENAKKVQEGDVLKVKSDTNGALLSCREITVLEKKSQEEDFIDAVSASFVPSGVYMKAINSSVALDFSAIRSYSPGFVQASGSVFFLQYKNQGQGLNFDANGNIYPNTTIPRGTTIDIFVEILAQIPGFLGFSTGTVTYNLNKTYTSSSNYIDIIDWWNGDNIGLTLGSDSQGGLATYNSTLATVVNAGVPGGVKSGSVDIPFLGPGFRWYKDGNKIYLLIGGYNVASDYIKCEIKTVKSGETIVFETQPQDAAPDIWYESPISYPITGGFHTGNVQDQTASQPAIINTAFQNCFSFGNGVESYKIRDSITRSSFGLGNRVSGVLKGEEFKQVHRFADLTYSGIYNYNINNFNEFNLGLLNFKALEPSFGLIQKIFARQTDILVLQEDKISYVLAGKNLLSDSAAGGAITSAPDVLGTQIARMEEYGIGANAESFANYGFEKYFTDSKRGVVIQLKGSAYSNEQLTVISGLGMSSWFRNLFIENPNTQKLGGYDPYSKEYVLSSNQTLLPIKEQIVEAGIKKTVVATVDAPVSYTVDLGVFIGNVTLTYNVKNIRNEFLLRVEYNSVNYDTSLTNVTSGTVTIPKTEVEPRTAVLSVTSVTASANARIELDVQVSRPDSPIVNIIQVCVSDSNESAETIHNEYQWTSGTFVSPLQSQFVSLSEGNESPLVSQYNKITGPQGGGVIPINGASVEIISKKYQSDNFDFDNTVNNFGFLRSSTLYSNTPTDIANLISASTSIAPTGSGAVFSGSFTMPTSADQYLYLIYDYRKPVAITLCYSNTSADDSCCTCGTSATYYIDAPTFEQATAVYTTAALTTKATDGWYSYQGNYRKQTTGVLETTILCSACNFDCGTSLVLDTISAYYTINADLGATTGAVVIDIDFKTLPDGIKVVYDGVTYNAVFSPNFGYLSSTGTEPLYTGITAFDCSISGTTYDNLIDFQFNGNGFNATGEIKSVTVDPASVSLQPSGLGICKMIIPKTAASPSIAEITIISPCDSAEIEIDVFCPTALTAFTTTRNAPEATSISGLCTSVTPTSFYNVPVGGTSGNPGLGDIIYQDANGATLAASGYYAVVGYPAATGVIFVDSNGIVTSITACVP